MQNSQVRQIVQQEFAAAVFGTVGVVVLLGALQCQFLEGWSLRHVRPAHSKGHVHTKGLKVVKGKPEFLQGNGSVRVRVDGFEQIFGVFLGVSHLVDQMFLEFFECNFAVAILIDTIKDGIDLVQQINFLLAVGSGTNDPSSVDRCLRGCSL